MTPSPVALEVYETYDISSPHMDDQEEDIRICFFEEKLSFHSLQKFSSDSSILNSMHSLPVIVSEKEEEFDFYISNDVSSVHISNTMDILEIISDCRSDPFTLIDIELPTNSYMIACIDTQGFEEGENCASAILVEDTIGSDMNLFGYDTILFGSDLILFGSSFKFQELPIVLVAVLINFGVKDQIPKISFKIYVGDLMSVFSHEFSDIIFCKYLDILEKISDLRIDLFTLFDIELPHS